MTRRRSTSGSIAVAVVGVLAAALLWWAQTGGPGGHPTLERQPQKAAVVRVADLPPEARETLALIDAGGPFPYPDHDGGTFGNYEGLLPSHQRGYYREYTVDTPGSEDRGARRIIAGDAGERYWTQDHYASFARIRR